MSRRNKPESREVYPDRKYSSVPLQLLIHRVMRRERKVQQNH